jgi:hypothetical protein
VALKGGTSQRLGESVGKLILSQDVLNDNNLVLYGLTNPEVLDLHVLLGRAVLGIASCQVIASVFAKECDGTVVRMPEL